MQMGGGIENDVMQEADDGMALNVQDIDAYWLQRKISQAYKQQINLQQSLKVAEDFDLRLSRSSDLSTESLDLAVFLSSIASVQSTPSESSIRPARLEARRQQKIDHGGHEVGDTQEDPLYIPSDEEKEVVVRLPPKSEVSSPVNPDYDSDYLDFLAEMEVMAEESSANIPPTPPQMARPDASPSPTLVPALSWIDPPSPLTPTPSSVTGESPARTTPST
nr:DExH-box ATP-dependent RNA helicase DExH12-like [Ipomoea batatas]